ncbi:pectinesterase-like [Primulina huaijiensis]|uniref:pectinesterase-like n=1 Tax=Primulina huaijiensis TaxID=1492673 RepID=UPI003CC70B15
MSYVCIVLSLISALRAVYPQRTFIVAKDGSGNFTTISQEKINLYLVGDGIDKTRISGNRSANMGFLTYDTATVRVATDGFVAKEVTFENTAGVNMNQSVAVTIEGLYSAFYRCRFLGYQDTLYVWHGIQFFRECDIYGTVDFIFGKSRALFQNCNVYARRPRQGQSNTITAQGRESENFFSGIVMQNCTIAAAPDLLPRFNVRSYLGRPLHNYSTTVIMQSFLDKLIDPRGWLEWVGQGHGVEKVYYAEYDNRGPGANTNSRVKWAHTIKYREANKFTARNFIQGQKWIGLTKIPYYLDL